MSIYTEITECRICQSKDLVDILDLGEQALTGVFPNPDEELQIAPVTVCKCSHCDLVQLRHTVDLNLMYGETYGYRSSLNQSMIDHLESVAKKVKSLVHLKVNDIIVDIGANDATLLQFFDSKMQHLVGIDPTAIKFQDQYGEQVHGGNIRMIPDFFSKKAYTEVYGEHKAKVVTSISCFYDLENPVQFAKETADILADDGIWLMEMAYLPFIIKNLCFDGYVSEHLEFYSLKDIKYIMDRANLKIIDVGFNDVNGGSFSVTVTHEDNKAHEEYWRLQSLLQSESHLSTLDTHLTFADDVEKFKARFVELLTDLKKEGKTVYGLGASTKFNVVLQHCNIGPDLLPAIGEVNADKFGKVTPGTRIPIVSEKEILDKQPDYVVIGPYHFRNSFIKILDDYLNKGGKIIFPLPNLEVYSK